MKKILILISFIHVLSLQTNLHAQKCEKETHFGDIKICIPKIAGMTECYSDSIVRKKASRVFNGKGMSVFAFYLPNKVYEKIRILDSIQFDDFFFIYSQENMKNAKGSTSDLDKVAEIMKGSFADIDWELDETIIENEIVNIGKPVLLDSYSPHKEARSLVGLTYAKSDEFETVGITIMNLLIVKERLIMLSYFSYYTNEDSEENAKAKNDYIVLRLLDENKLNE